MIGAVARKLFGSANERRVLMRTIVHLSDLHFSSDFRLIPRFKV